VEKKEDNKRKVHSWRPFAEARAFVRKLELKSHAEWVAYCKSGKKPPDIPAYPLGVYRAEYQGTDDWLGTGRTRKFRSFTEARAFVHRLGLKSWDEWEAYCKSGRKPPDIPTHPDKVYWLEFESMGDWLGTGKPSTRNRKYRPFIEARAFVRKLELKSHKDWQAYSKSGKRPHDIPSQPWRVYTSEYKDMGDWLGVELTRHYRLFAEARAFVRKLELKSHAEWVAYCKSGKKPPDIPSWPNRVYRSDYKGINDWLGVYRSFTEARAFVHRLKLNTTAQWRAYCKSGKKPPAIPATPMKVYSNEYKSMGDWLGTTSRWDSKALLTFLIDLRPQLVHLEKRELYDLLQQNGALNPFRRVLGKATSMRAINDLMKNEGRDLEQALRKAMNENIQIRVDGTTIETEAAKVIDTAEFFEHENSIAVSAHNEPSVPVSVLQSKTATHYFDVFLCYNSKSRTIVKKVGEQLKEEGISPWLDEWELPPGMPWQRLLEKQIGQIKSAAVFVGKDGVGPWQQLEIEGFLREFVRRKCPVIPVLLADALRKPKLPLFLAGMTWVDFRRQDVDPMRQLIWGITGKRRT
jgi:TIR domain/Phage-integrase repeat unit